MQVYEQNRFQLLAAMRYVPLPAGLAIIPLLRQPYLYIHVQMSKPYDAVRWPCPLQRLDLATTERQVA